jgi:hypothetical protein
MNQPAPRRHDGAAGQAEGPLQIQGAEHPAMTPHGSVVSTPDEFSPLDFRITPQTVARVCYNLGSS